MHRTSSYTSGSTVRKKRIVSNNIGVPLFSCVAAPIWFWAQAENPIFNRWILVHDECWMLQLNLHAYGETWQEGY